MKSKKGQLKISFGMIFAIILIIVFIVFAFIAINKFLEFQKNAQINQFMNNLQNDITSTYTSQSASNIETYSVPSNVIKVCFVNSNLDNLEIYTKGSLIPSNTNELKDIDLNNTFPGGNSRICTNATDNKVSIKLTKDYYSSLVTVSV